MGEICIYCVFFYFNKEQKEVNRTIIGKHIVLKQHKNIYIYIYIVTEMFSPQYAMAVSQEKMLFISNCQLKKLMQPSSL